MKVLWVEVEYQPNLQRPVTPIPLGVIVEAVYGRQREVVLIGRQPKVSLPELQIENTWGPFREIVTNWFETVWKSLVGTMNETAENTFVVDRLAGLWTANLYLKEPQSLAGSAHRNLLTVARHRYQVFVGERVPPFAGERPRARPVKRWMNYTLQATG